MIETALVAAVVAAVASGAGWVVLNFFGRPILALQEKRLEALQIADRYSRVDDTSNDALRRTALKSLNEVGGASGKLGAPRMTAVYRPHIRGCDTGNCPVSGERMLLVRMPTRSKACPAGAARRTGQIDLWLRVLNRDEPAVVHGDGRIDQVASERPQPRQNPVLVGSGKPRIADDIGHQDRGQFPGLIHGRYAAATVSAVSGRPGKASGGHGKDARGMSIIGLSMAALPCCAEEDVEAGSAALRVDWPVYPRHAEHNTVAEGGNRRWAETA